MRAFPSLACASALSPLSSGSLPLSRFAPGPRPPLPPQQASKPIKHPCLPKGASVTHKGHSLVGEGDWHKCKKLQRGLFDTETCPFASCSFGGAYQPALPKTFYGFSYLYDRTAAIGLLDHKQQPFGEQQMSLADIERAGAELCGLPRYLIMKRP